MNYHFSAPWGLKLKVTTAVFAAVGLYAFVASDATGSAVVLAVYALCAALAVRGYTVVDNHLLVHRLGWATRFDLAGLRDVRYEPGLTEGSVRVLGVGGLFGFVGLFRNATLGVYGAYATDSARSVVLELADKTVVVTPDRPADFVRVVQVEQGDL